MAQNSCFDSEDSTQSFQKSAIPSYTMPGADGVAAEETPVPAEEGIGSLGVQEQEPWRNHDYTSLMQHVNNSLNVRSISTCIPVLTPQGSILHFKALMTPVLFVGPQMSCVKTLQFCWWYSTLLVRGWHSIWVNLSPWMISASSISPGIYLVHNCSLNMPP